MTFTVIDQELSLSDLERALASDANKGNGKKHEHLCRMGTSAAGAGAGAGLGYLLCNAAGLGGAVFTAGGSLALNPLTCAPITAGGAVLGSVGGGAASLKACAPNATVVPQKKPWGVVDVGKEVERVSSPEKCRNSSRQPVFCETRDGEWIFKGCIDPERCDFLPTGSNTPGGGLATMCECDDQREIQW